MNSIIDFVKFLLFCAAAPLLVQFFFGAAGKLADKISDIFND